MIIARSPFRISFAGGGTDIPAFYKKWGPGVVVSTSINKHIYVSLSNKFGGGISLRYKIHEHVEKASDLKHGLVREALTFYGIEDGVELVISSDVPARGSGLGASSALGCALVAAIERFVGAPRVRSSSIRHHWAETASRIEIERVGSPIGKQDHYASALGGFNKLTFNTDDTVDAESLASDEFEREIELQSMLFYLKIEHDYEQDGKFFVQRVLKEQIAEMERTHWTYELQRDNALQMWDHLRYEVPERFIDHVNENWRLKRGVHAGVSNRDIDAVIQRAYAAGATAAKVCGAGGGGFLYLVAPRSMQESVRNALSALTELQFRFDRKGTEVIFDDAEPELAIA